MVHLRSQLKGFSESGILSEKEKDKMELPTSFRVHAGFMGNLVTVSNEGPSKDCRDYVRGGVWSACSFSTCCSNEVHKSLPFSINGAKSLSPRQRLCNYNRIGLYTTLNLFH